MLLAIVAVPALAGQDCEQYGKDTRLYLAKATVGAEPLKRDPADPSKSQLCHLSLNQDKEGFIESLDLSGCPIESRAAIGTAILKSSPLPKPEDPKCWRKTMTLSLQSRKTTEQH